MFFIFYIYVVPLHHQKWRQILTEKINEKKRFNYESYY